MVSSSSACCGDTADVALCVIVVSVVDASSSMRNNDVPGYTTRLDVVYECSSRGIRLSLSSRVARAFASL